MDHPGKMILQECIEPLELTITDAAKGLGVSRKALSELVNCRAGGTGHNDGLHQLQDVYEEINLRQFFGDASCWGYSGFVIIEFLRAEGIRIGRCHMLHFERAAA